MSTPIPQPPTVPFLGNVLDIDPKNSMQSLVHIGEKYGPIFKLTVLGRERYFITSADLLNELCDETRFCKAVSGALQQVRNGVGDGLFTAYHGEHNWEVAHRTLVPAFGTIGIHDMYDEMYDIATQLIAKWARVGPEQQINVTDDFTRLTLDSIALCAMGKRFNSFYSEKMNPFVDAMVGFLLESGRRLSRTRIESLFNRSADRQYQQDIATMKAVAEEVIAHRRANPVDKKDLLNAMLFGKDPKTGERLSDENIMNNMITFLIAGHETTSGLLSFTCYHLIKNPDALSKAQQEVDTVVGKGPVTYQHMSKLPYIEAVLRETLRLQPTAPAFALQPLENVSGPVVIGGEYFIPQDASIVALLPAIGRDPKAFGADADEYKPERMYGDNFAKLPPNAWKPFGNGARGCIGRPFAWQEAILTLALILQNFNIRADNPSYQLQIKQTLTLKPDNFFMRASLREGIDPVQLERKMYAGLEVDDARHKPKAGLTKHTQSSKPMLILYGSNSGTCEGLAQNLASNAEGRGFAASVKTLDAAVDLLPTKQPVVVITASYEGNPPDNAAVFVEWLKKVDPEKVKDVTFAVFGCGHHDWVATFQKVPKLIESELLNKGASPLTGRGESDVGGGNVFDDFDSWQDEKLWPALSAESEPAEVSDGLEMELSTTARASHLRHNVQEALVLANELLTNPDTPEKRHTEFRLPTNLTYEAGDYLALLPVNNVTTISRVLRRFGLPWDAVMTLRRGAHTTIPTETAMAVTAVLGAYVELNSPATRKNILTLRKYAGDDELAEKLASITEQLSVLQILERYTGLNLPFSVYLSMLTPMRIRQYSISSTPLEDPTKASIIYSVVDSGAGHLGVATNYLKRLQPGTTVQLTIKKSHASFHLPRDRTTPIIMVCAGTGLAPFIGFVQERAIRIATSGAKSEDFAEAILIVGCRYPDKDRIYGEQLAKWEAEGVVKLLYAYSRAPDKSDGCKYAQDRLWRERETVSRLFDAGARAYICGSSSLGKGVADAAARMAIDGARRKGKEYSYEQGLQWWEHLRGERYAVDVFD
ncbi:cytochrome P450 [Exophiala viscosa]|uniref:cytochrome P450 n=1 Tax=Exophiala viscosa TaxID=2486360 RepID=UPI00219CB845|nr:cytochrome P450 [Exophiala viscosa]